MQDIKIPELAVYRCQDPNHQPQVAEKGGQMLCQQCVNEFLARNVGMMEEVRPELKPVAEVAGGFAPPRVEGDGTG